MWNLLKILIGGVLGYGIAKLQQDSNKKIAKKDDGFYIFVRSDEFGKSSLYFDDYTSAKKMYDKIVLSKKIKYKDIIDLDISERELYEKWKSEGKTKEDGYPTLNSTSKVQTIILSNGNSDFEEKNFKQNSK
jgi:hypothetical protein